MSPQIVALLISEMQIMQAQVLTCHSLDILGSELHGHLHSCLLPPLPESPAEEIKPLDILFIALLIVLLSS